MGDNPWHADDESSIRPETKTGWYKTKKGKDEWTASKSTIKQASKQASKQANPLDEHQGDCRAFDPDDAGPSLSGRDSRR